MRVLIVDDEPLARQALTRIVSDRSDIERCDSATDAVSALEKLKAQSYDVLLLDISMPEISGFELVDSLREASLPGPSIVFVTAFHEHALKAFEKQAVDYVLKPFSEDRVHSALDRAARRSSAERAAQLLEALPQLQGQHRQQPARVAIKVNGRILFVDPAQVVAVKAEGNYVMFHQGNGSNLLRASISVVADKLKPFGFIRIHRSVLINGAFVEEIRPCSTGEYVVRVKGGQTYTVTRTYKNNLQLISDHWIGVEPFSAE